MSTLSAQLLCLVVTVFVLGILVGAIGSAP